MNKGENSVKSAYEAGVYNKNQRSSGGSIMVFGDVSEKAAASNQAGVCGKRRGKHQQRRVPP